MCNRIILSDLAQMESTGIHDCLSSVFVNDVLFRIGMKLLCGLSSLPVGELENVVPGTVGGSSTVKKRKR